MNDIFTQYGRLDRAIADNLADIRSSFDDDATLVLDFIIFISRQMKTDLFGYTRFTLKDFCKVTGRRRQELAMKHSRFSNKNAPVIEGFTFETVFDYALLRMMSHNLIFSSVYKDTNGDRIVHLESIRLLSDVKITIAKSKSHAKIYDVKISHELLNGFIRRYYSIDIEAYRLAGLTKGKERRQALVVYLSILRHTLRSKGLCETTVSVDAMANRAGIYGKTTFHRKEALQNSLNHLRDKAKFPFAYSFVESGNTKYNVKLHFQEDNSGKILSKEHVFFFALITELKAFFEYTRKSNDIDSFQNWLNSEANKELKVAELKKTYQKVFAQDISDDQAFNILKNGF